MIKLKRELPIIPPILVDCAKVLYEVYNAFLPVPDLRPEVEL